MGEKWSADPIGFHTGRPIRLWIAVMVAWGIGVLAIRAADRVQTGLENSRLHTLALDAFFDPARNFLDATVRLRFNDPAAERCLFLAEGLEVSSVTGGARTPLRFQRDAGLLFVQGGGEMELEFRYSGRLLRDQPRVDASASQDIPELPVPTEDCHFLSYLQDFYPQPRLDFIPLRMNIRLPGEWNCLGSGTLLAVDAGPGFNTYRFENEQAKGATLIVGHFRQLERLEGVIPIRIHGWPGCNYKKYFSAAGMARALSFLAERFGALNLPELNILFRSGRNLGGTSTSGLIILNLEEAPPRVTTIAAENTQAGSMFLAIDAMTDLLIHELAHQWWGGLVSWKTSADNCITEGLATFSTLLYLRERCGEKAYRKTLKRMRQQVERYADLGVPAQGALLKLINRDPMAYQALVYVKPALMLAALADRLGERELLFRLRSILNGQRGCNLDSAEFLKLLSSSDQGLDALLHQWLFNKGLPPDGREG